MRADLFLQCVGFVLELDNTCSASFCRRPVIGYDMREKRDQLLRAAITGVHVLLYRAHRRRASKEQLISEASARIGSAINLENILQTTAEELERVLGGSEVLIQFQNNKEAQQ
jgi:hypothetical protein